MFVKMIVGKKEKDLADVASPVTTTIAECARVWRNGNRLVLEGTPDGEGTIEYEFKAADRVRVFVMSDTGATVDHFTLSPSG